MKILYHHRTQSKDGQRVHIEELIHAFRAAGCEVIVVEPGSASDTDFGDESKLIATIRRFLPKAAYELLELGYSVVAYRKLRQAYLEHRPDFLYERYNVLTLAGTWLKKRYGIPYVLEVNSPIYAERLKNDGLALPALARWSERHVWQAADAVLPVTAVLGDILVTQGVDRSRITVIPNGIDPADFATAPPREEAKRRLGAEGKLVLGFTGFVRPWHGLDQVIDLMAQTGHAHWFLLVVGDGPARQALEEQAARLGLADRVRFTGVVPRERIPETVASFDIALQPAATEYASPLKLFEYMAMGCAIVAPAQPNILEILTHEQNALLFTPGQPAAMARELARLADDPGLRTRLGATASETVVSKQLYWSGNARRIMGLARNLTRPGSPVQSATVNR